jgi:hypothetical protein
MGWFRHRRATRKRHDADALGARRALIHSPSRPLGRRRVSDSLRLAGTALLIHEEEHSVLVDQGVFDVSLVLPFLLAGERVEGAGLVSLPRNEVLGLSVVNTLFEKTLDQKLVVGLVFWGQTRLGYGQQGWVVDGLRLGGFVAR